jgi:predicted nucleic acid-binding protein
MLNRLRQVLEEKFEASRQKVDQYLEAIVGYAQLEEAYGPSLTLGGTGLLPLTDEEDAHVIDTAIAGESDILVTANFRDFLPRHVEVLAHERLARFRHPKGDLLIAHPYVAGEWLEAGRIQLPE